jgi:hypothetical protein
MSTPFLGFGLAPAGTSAFGYGSPATANANTGLAMTKDDGSQGAARMIDPHTRDYRFDKNGRAVGIDGIPQQVYLALLTVLNSSAVSGLGNAIGSIKTITENIKAQISNEVARALSKLTAAKLVKLVDVEVELNTNHAPLIHVRWIDLTNNTTNLVSV